MGHIDVCWNLKGESDYSALVASFVRAVGNPSWKWLYRMISDVRAVTALKLLKETVVEAGTIPDAASIYAIYADWVCLRRYPGLIPALDLNSRLSEHTLLTLCNDLDWFSIGLDDGWTCCGFVLRWCTAIHRRSCSRVRRPSDTGLEGSGMTEHWWQI